MSESDGSCLLLATDLHDPIRSSIEHGIRSAKKSVTLIIYSLSDKTIIRALQAAAEAGVRVQVIYDPEETREGGFLLGKKVYAYPRRFSGLMHNKLLAIDATTVWIGSANMSTHSLLQQGNLVVTMHSPRAAQAIEQLATAMIHKKAYSLPPLEIHHQSQTISLFFNPYHSQKALRMLLDRIDKATTRVFVAMFTLTHRELDAALVRAHLRGVDVRVIFDQESSRVASKAVFTKLQRLSIPCGKRTKPGLLHYKVALIDDTLIAGSCNWTRAAFTLNHEAILVLSPLSSPQLDWAQRWWLSVEQYSTLKVRGQPQRTAA